MHQLLCLSLVVIAAGPLTAQDVAKRQTIEYVRSLQQHDGGFAADAATRDKKLPSSLRATSAALRALKYLGGEAKDKSAAGKFIAACYDPATGTYDESPGAKNTASAHGATSVGIMGAAAAGLPADPYLTKPTVYLVESSKTFEERRLAAGAFESAGAFPDAVTGWIKDVRATANSDGIFGAGDGRAQATGSAVAMVLRTGAKFGDAQKSMVLRTLRADQMSDGGYGKPGTKVSDLETTYRVMRAFHLLGEKPDVAKLLAFVAKCRNADGGYSAMPGEPSGVGPTYFAAIVQHWADD